MDNEPMGPSFAREEKVVIVPSASPPEPAVAVCTAGVLAGTKGFTA